MQTLFSRFTYAPKGPRADSFISTIFLAICHFGQCLQGGVAAARGNQLLGETHLLTKETSDPGVSHQSPTKSPDSATEDRVGFH